MLNVVILSIMMLNVVGAISSTFWRNLRKFWRKSLEFLGHIHNTSFSFNLKNGPNKQECHITLCCKHLLGTNAIVYLAICEPRVLNTAPDFRGDGIDILDVYGG